MLGSCQPPLCRVQHKPRSRAPLVCSSHLSAPISSRLDRQTFRRPRGALQECVYTWPYPHEIHLPHFLNVLPKFQEAATTHGLNSKQVNIMAAQLYFNINQLGSELITWENKDNPSNLNLPHYMQKVTTSPPLLSNHEPHTKLALYPAKYTNNDIIMMLITLVFIHHHDCTYPLPLGSHYASLACTLPTARTEKPPVCQCSWQLLPAADVNARRSLITAMGDWKPLHRLKLMGMYQDQEPQWALMGYCNWWLSRFAADIVGDVWHDGSSLNTCLTDPAGNLAPEYGLRGPQKPAHEDTNLGSFWDEEDGEAGMPWGSNETLEEQQRALQLTERNAYAYDPDEAGDDEEVGVVFRVGEQAASRAGMAR